MIPKAGDRVIARVLLPVDSEGNIWHSIYTGESEGMKSFDVEGVATGDVSYRTRVLGEPSALIGFEGRLGNIVQTAWVRVSQIKPAAGVINKDYEDLFV